MVFLMAQKWKIAIVVFIASGICLVGCSDLDPENIPLGTHDYASMQSARCTTSTLQGGTGRTDHAELAGGLKFSIRTPANYDSTYQHPLIVVYSAARQNRFRTEAVTGFTTSATAAGFIVAYVDSVRLSLQTIKLLSQIPMAIAKKWCVDQTRVYLTGHSDGGTVSNAIAFMPDVPIRPRAIAPSAAGIRISDMEDVNCPPEVSVMTWQNHADKLFPGYGQELAKWWSECHQCSEVTEPLSARCETFANCSPGVEIAICTNEGKHRDWPNADQDVLEFFMRN